MAYDQRCYELAGAFLEELEFRSPEERALAQGHLAQRIQDTIEEELSEIPIDNPEPNR